MLPRGSAPPASASASGTAPLAPRARQKRVHVAIACDRCRTHRTKCDDNRPCSNCKNSNAQCSNSNSAAASTPPHAQREIARLRARVQELESRLRDMAPAEPSQTLTPSSMGGPETPHTGNKPYVPVTATVQAWNGTLVRTARSAKETWYGPSSLHYFTRRFTNFLSTALHQTISADGVLPESAAKLLHEPTSHELATAAYAGTSSGLGGSIPTGALLTPTQEEYFLSLYWQSYHTALFPILDEEEFKEHYRSLWKTNSAERQPSSLVDIVLAMCMQYGVSSMPKAKQGTISDNKDATIAGRWHYRRCQMLLNNELETPTISTVQCHLLCCIFLCCASFQNMADAACGLAVRSAYMLGLHLEPPATSTARERELRKRLWWALHLLDSKIGMKLGRPFLLHDAPDMPGLPGDGLEAAAVSGSSFAPLSDSTTWLSFNLLGIKLFQAAKQVHVAFYGRELAEGQTGLDDAQTLESHASFFRPHANVMQDWANRVPAVLKSRRQNGGTPFSTDASALDIEQFAPAWLQRQQVILELMYHNLCINLYRPFISFTSSSTPSSAAAEAANKSAAHAVALTRIVHQVLSSTDILNGWLEAFQFQWNAAMTLVGFLLANHDGPSIVSARNGLQLAIEVCDIFGNSFPVAASAAIILRDLGVKLDFLSEQRQTNYAVTGVHEPILEHGTIGSDVTMVPDATVLFDDKVSQQAVDVTSQEIFGMAIAVDLWSDLDMLWQNTGSAMSEPPMLGNWQNDAWITG